MFVSRWDMVRFVSIRALGLLGWLSVFALVIGYVVGRARALDRARQEYEDAKGDPRALALAAADDLKQACLNEVQDGTCRVLMRMYGTNAIVDIPGGDCLASISAVRYTLPSTKILSGPLQENKEEEKNE